MKYFVAIIAAITILGAGCTTDRSTNGTWELSGSNFESVSNEIAAWATTNFSGTDSKVTFGAVRNDTIPSNGELRLIASYQTQVIDIPDGRRVGEYPEPTEPIHFFIFVLEDEAGLVFRTFVQSTDGKTFKVTAFGPAIDRNSDPNAPNGQLRLDTWPSKDVQAEAARHGGKLVMIPYPYPMNQVYYQLGSTVESSRLVNAETGASYNGLTDLLDSIESDWDHLK